MNRHKQDEQIATTLHKNDSRIIFWKKKPGTCVVLPIRDIIYWLTIMLSFDSIIDLVWDSKGAYS